MTTLSNFPTLVIGYVQYTYMSTHSRLLHLTPENCFCTMSLNSSSSEAFLQRNALGVFLSITCGECHIVPTVHRCMVEVDGPDGYLDDSKHGCGVTVCGPCMTARNIEGIHKCTRHSSMKAPHPSSKTNSEATFTSSFDWLNISKKPQVISHLAILHAF